jgi:hypothetical protein
MGEHMTRDELKEVLLSANDEPRMLFVKHFGAQVDEFADRACRACNRFVDLGEKIPGDERTGWTQAFLFSAFNSAVTSFHLLVLGLLAPSGNQMRHFSESIAMALLCSHPGINTFEHFRSDPSHFPVHNAMTIAKRKQNARVLEFDDEGWAEFERINRFFDKYSHASALAVSSLRKFSEPKTFILGGEFDPTKIGAYEKLALLQISACDVLYSVIERIEQLLLDVS